MIDIQEITKKLNDLRELRPDWHEDSIRQMNDWEQQIVEAIAKSDYASNEITQRILNQLKGFIKAISQRLSNDSRIDEIARISLFAERKAYLWFIALFSKDFYKEIKEIEEQIDFELSREK